MAATVAVDPVKYADEFRKSLMEDLFGDEGLEATSRDEASDGSDSEALFEASSRTSSTPLLNLDENIEALHNHEIVRSILDEGHPLKEHAREVDDELRLAELESIQHYIGESENMVALHEQVL